MGGAMQSEPAGHEGPPAERATRAREPRLACVNPAAPYPRMPGEHPHHRANWAVPAMTFPRPPVRPWSAPPEDDREDHVPEDPDREERVEHAGHGAPRQAERLGDAREAGPGPHGRAAG